MGGLPNFDVIMSDDYGCDVHSFDHTIDPHGTAAETEGNFHLMGLGVAKDASEPQDGGLVSLSTIRSRVVGDALRAVDVLKVDCEGCEWEALELDPAEEGSASDNLVGVKQVMFEFHLGSGGGYSLKKAANLFRRLHRSGFRMFYRNLNPWSTGARDTESLVQRMREVQGGSVADQFVMSKANMIRMGNEAGYGWKEFEYDLWKHHVQENLFVCCFEVGFIRVDAAGVASKFPVSTRPAAVPITPAVTEKIEKPTAPVSTAVTSAAGVDVTAMSDEDVLLRIAVGDMEYDCKSLKTIGPKGADGGWDGEKLD